LRTSSVADLWDTLSDAAARESGLWEAALRPLDLQEREPVFSVLAEERYRLGLETIYEGYLLHYGRARLFTPTDGDTALLLGDYLYAHGLVRIAQAHVVEAVSDLAELISLCAQVRAEGRTDDGPPWVATASCMGKGLLEDARAVFRDERDDELLLDAAWAAAGTDAVERALQAHRARVG
jgi:hypothetical protein